MPRHPRLDAPAVLHHVMVRGIERTTRFRDAADRAAFVARLAALAEHGAWTVDAWALLPTHAPLRVRTGTRPLPRSMRSLLTGDAGAFNRRQHRVGHLCQNRYKSIVVEADPYRLDLVRYLHLNPVRAQVVPTLRSLDRYPGTGHRARLGTVPRPWQATQAILAPFGRPGPGAGGHWLACSRRWRRPRGCPRTRSRAAAGRRASPGRAKGSPTSGVGSRANPAAPWPPRSVCPIKRCPPPRPGVSAPPPGGPVYGDTCSSCQRMCTRAHQFVLADENGETRATLSIGRHGPELSLWDENGKLRNVLMVGENGPSLTLFDENGGMI